MLAVSHAPNWTVVVAVLTGLLAVWYLLPTPRRRCPYRGAVVALLAVVGFGVVAVGGFGSPVSVGVETVLFAAFALLAFLFGVLMITQRNPARSAVYFAVVILNVCGLFLLQGAPFLTAATIVIYAGAIIVTFLFVIMLSRQTGPSDANDRAREPSLASAAGFVVLATLLIGLERVYDTSEIDAVIARAIRLADGPMLDDTFRNAAAAEGYLRDIKNAKDRLGYREGASLRHPDIVRARVMELEYAISDLSALVAALQPPTGAKPDDRPPQLDPDDVGGLPALNRQIHDSLAFLKAVREGRFNPHDDVRLSPYGQARPVGVGSVGPPQPGILPAGNVAALGRTLFTDHLIAVELGGTLLLVATIGAIAIAGGRRRAGQEEAA